MRCSYSEARLDAYVDGTLSPPERARVQAHVADCERCRRLLEEFRVIDALLLTPRRLEPAPNFTFKVMADVRTTPQPHVRLHSPLPMLGAYVVFAWATIGAFLLWGGTAARGMLAAFPAAAQHAGSVFNGLAAAAGHLFGSQTPDVTAAMATLLAADVCAAGIVVALYGLRRSRRAAASAASTSC